MTYLEISRGGTITTRVPVADAGGSCTVAIDNLGEIELWPGDTARLGDYELKLVEAGLGAVPGTATHGPPPAEAATIIINGRSLAETLILNQENATSEQRPELEGYDVYDALGRGGMGTVWRARQLSTRRVVALKVLGAKAGTSEQAHARFSREVELTAQLEHPNIARVYDSGLHHGVYFYAMELIKGVPLDVFVHRQGLALRPVLALMRDVCRAMQYAHQRGVIHRDLKPSNILVTADGQPHIVDFGLAKLLDDVGGLTVSLPGEIAGTPAFMSPEQASGKVLDTRSDVYSLGVMLYRLLLRRWPRDMTGTHLELLNRIAHDEVIRPRQARRDFDVELEAVLLAALALAPDERYSSAGDLADDLDNYLNGEPLAARRATTVYFLRKRLWKYRVPVAASLLVAGGLFGLAVAAYVRVAAARARAERSADSERQARIEAVRQRREARHQRDLAEQERQRAEAKADESLRRLIRLHVAAGNDALRRGDPLAALVPFAQALALEPEPTRQTVHRIRVGALLRRCPRPVAMWLHRGPVPAVAVSASGEFLASASWDGTARLVRLPDGDPLGEPLVHGGTLTHAAFSPDSRHLLTCGMNGDVRLWSVGDDPPSCDVLRHRDPVLHAAFSPDGNCLVTATGVPFAAQHMVSIPGPPRTMQIQTGPGTFNTITMPGPTQQIPQPARGFATRWALSDTPPTRQLLDSIDGWATHVAYSRDGSRIAVASGRMTGPGAVQVFDAATGEPVGPALPHRFDVNTVAFSPDGTRLVTSGGNDYDEAGETVLWKVREGTRIGEPISHSQRVVDARFSPDGARVVTAGWDGTACLRAASDGRLISAPLHHRHRVSSCRFSADGTQVLTTSWDGIARLWDVASGRLAAPMLHHGSPVLTAVIVPGSTRIAVGTWSGAVRLWEMAPPQTGVYQTSRSAAVAVLGFTADGGHLASIDSRESGLVVYSGGRGRSEARMQRRYGSLTVWSFTGAEQAEAALGDGFSILTWAAQVRTALFLQEADGGGAVLRFLDTATGLAVCPEIHLPEKPGQATLSDDVRRLALATRKNRALLVYDLENGQQLGQEITSDSTISRMQWTRDGRRLAVCDENHTLCIYHIDAAAWEGEPVPLPGPVSALACSPDGGQVAVVIGRPPLSLQRQESVIVCSLAGGRPAGPPLEHRDRIAAIAFSPDSAILATACADGAVRLWPMGDSTAPPLVLEHDGGVNCVAFSPDGRLLISGGDDRMARVWDAVTGDPMGLPERFDGQVLCVAFSPDGRWVGAGSDAGEIRVWEIVADQRPVAALMGWAELLSGQTIIADGATRTLGIEELKARAAAAGILK